MVEMVGLGEGKVHGGYRYGTPLLHHSSNVNRHWHKHVRKVMTQHTLLLNPKVVKRL